MSVSDTSTSYEGNQGSEGARHHDLTLTRAGELDDGVVNAALAALCRIVVRILEMCWLLLLLLAPGCLCLLVKFAESQLLRL